MNLDRMRKQNDRRKADAGMGERFVAPYPGLYEVSGTMHLTDGTPVVVHRQVLPKYLAKGETIEVTWERYQHD
jgi:hypothetical protein